MTAPSPCCIQSHEFNSLACPIVVHWDVDRMLYHLAVVRNACHEVANAAMPLSVSKCRLSCTSYISVYLHRGCFVATIGVTVACALVTALKIQSQYCTRSCVTTCPHTCLNTCSKYLVCQRQHVQLHWCSCKTSCSLNVVNNSTCAATASHAIASHKH